MPKECHNRLVPRPPPAAHADTLFLWDRDRLINGPLVLAVLHLMAMFVLKIREGVHEYSGQIVHVL